MKKITSIITLVLASSFFAKAQTNLAWKDSTITIIGNKLSQVTTLGKDQQPIQKKEYYYGFDAENKQHVIHVTNTNLLADANSYSDIYKVLIPAASVDMEDLTVMSLDNSAFATGGYAYLTIRCKEEKDDMLTLSKSSYDEPFEAFGRTVDFSIEAEPAQKGALEKLIAQIKARK